MSIINEIRTIHPDGRITVEKTIDNDKITVNKRRKLGVDNFVFVFQKAVLEVVRNVNLGKNALKLLLYLIAKTEFEKEINATLYGIAKELGIQQSSASKAMKELTDINIVIRQKDLKTFRLNYEIAFKGSPKNYKKLQFKDEEVILLPFCKTNQTNIIDQIKEFDS